MGASAGYHVRDKILFATTVAIVALSTISYYLFQAPFDPQRCKVLLNEGFWLNPSGLTNWQPAGCMLHTYKAAEASHCLDQRRVVFIGGTSTRFLFEATAAKFDPEYKPASWGREANQAATLLGVRFEFVWDPYLESSELTSIRNGFDNDHSRPALTVIGIGHDFMRHEKEISRWTGQVGSVISGFAGGHSRRATQSDAIIFSPVLLPDSDKLSDSDKLTITSRAVSQMNDVLMDMAKEYNVDVAFAFNEVTRAPGALSDGLNPVPKAGTVMADILLNLRCNTQLPKHYPYASTCCNEYPRASWVQLAFFAFVCILVPIAYYLHLKGMTPDSSSFMRLMPAPKYLGSILVMGLTVVLCYYCDRTNIFGKEQKQTSPSQFFIGMGIIIAASLFTLHKADKDLPFLNRDQTDEWKGWMQVAILVYHYVGVSKTEYIYNYMRVCPTSYLFMTGFGHTVYFLKKDDYSFKRVVATMLRLNLLNVILAYVMGNDWLLYYFAPLVTWNFIVIWTLLWAGHKHNKNMKFLFGKMLVFALVNAAFNRIPGVLEGFWALLQGLLNMQGDLREWRFRVTLDQYSVFPGMIAAVLFINWGNYSLPKSQNWPSMHRIICTVSFAIMLWYAYFEVSQPSKVIYNTKHTYVSWLPCCAFVILRNATPWLRRTHNGFFAWVGRGSLETFLLQFHIWLGADTAGLLTFGFPYLRAINAVIATVVFLYVASLTTTATGTVIEWIMAAEAKPRPTLPTVRSHPAALPNGAQGEKGPLTGIPEGNSQVNSGVPINAAPADIKIQDPEKLEKDLHNISPSSRGGVAGALSTAGSDLRVRVGIILGAMAFMNWTYNWA